MPRLDGKIAFVTGASGGLGAHFARVLAGAGASVVLAARRADKLAREVAAIEADGAKAAAVALDVTDPDAPARALADAADALGPPDILVNNAGIVIGGPAAAVADSDWSAVLDTNLTGCFRMARAFHAARMRAGGGGAVVNIASILGLRASAQVAAYAASKAGLIHLTKVLALEWARDGIRVNALAPGYIETDLNRAFFASDAGRKLIARIPQRRLGRMADLDGPLLLLASDASAYMTGAVVAVDGGHLVNTL